MPDAPSNVTATGGDTKATVTWTAPFDGGKPIDEYIVSVSPSSGSGTQTVPGTQTSVTWTGLDDKVGPYSFTVVAHNADGVGPVSATSNSVYAHGTPDQPPAPKSSGAVATNQKSTAITVSWPELTNCKDAQPCASYTVTEISGGATTNTANVTAGQCTASSASCSASFEHNNTGAGYTYTLTAVNKEGDTSSPSPPTAPPVYAAGYPDQITNLSLAPADTAVKATFTLPPSNAAGISQVNYTINGQSGSWPNPGSSGQTVTETVSGLTNGTNYAMTVVACSQTSAGTTGGCGQPSNSASAVPYGTPYPPSVSASGDGVTATYFWSGGGNNGRAVQTYYYCIDSNPCSSSPSPNNTQVNYGACNQSHSIYGYVVDTVGQRSVNTPTTSVSLPCPSIASVQFVFTTGCELDPGGGTFKGYGGYYVVTLDTHDVPSQYVGGESVTTVYERYNNPSNTGQGTSTFTYSPTQSTYGGGPYGEPPGAWGGFWHEDYTNIFTVSFNVAGGGTVSQQLTTAFPAC